MSSVFEFVAESRSQSGSASAKKIRREGKVPAVIYGGGESVELVAIASNEVDKSLMHEAVYSHVLDIKVDGRTEKAILKDVQRHPAKSQVLHMDFLRVSEKDKVKVHVPLHFVNESSSVGAKKGGVVTHSLVDVEVTCLPGSLPEFIEVDLAGLDLGQSLHLSELALPAGVSVVALAQGADHDLPVVSIVASKGSKSDAGSEEGEAEADTE